MTEPITSTAAGDRQRTAEEVRASVRAMVLELAPAKDESVRGDATLINELGYHSLALLELAFTLEDEFDLEPIEEATARQISTVRKVEDHVVDELTARGEISRPG